MRSPEILWKTAKNFMGWKNSGAPVQLNVDGTLITSAKNIAQIMNQLFLEKSKSH